jgi:hypothetical protein
MARQQREHLGEVDNGRMAMREFEGVEMLDWLDWLVMPSKEPGDDGRTTRHSVYHGQSEPFGE